MKGRWWWSQNSRCRVCGLLQHKGITPRKSRENTPLLLNLKKWEAFILKNTPNFCRAYKEKSNLATFTAVLQQVENKGRYPFEEKEVCCFT